MTRSKIDLVLRAGTRGSALALAQTGIVVDLLKKKNHGLLVKTRTITTSGDGQRKNATITGKDSFTREIDLALQSGEIDFAVHSLKDVPIETGKPKFEIAAYPRRGSPYDVLISSNGGKTLDTLRPNARIGTSSVRRAIQLKLYRSDLEIVEIHGNVPTRIEKMRSNRSGLDAIVLAKAGLDRLRIESEIDEVIRTEVLLPAVGQGCLAVSVRTKDFKTRKIIETIDDERTRLAVTAERAFSSELGGGCNTPIAALAKVNGSKLSLEGLLAGVSKSRKLASEYAIRDKIDGRADRAMLLGKELARELKEVAALK